MGLRFRKIVGLFPGVRLNVTKHGLSSLSFGGKGITYNLGRKGMRGTLGLPGSGLSYSEYKSYKSADSQEPTIDPETGEILPPKPTSGPPWVLMLLIAAIVVGIYLVRA